MQSMFGLYLPDILQNSLLSEDIEILMGQAKLQLNVIRDKMRICKSVCYDADKDEAECYYLCLLCRNHADDEVWGTRHC